MVSTNNIEYAHLVLKNIFYNNVLGTGGFDWLVGRLVGWILNHKNICWLFKAKTRF